MKNSARDLSSSKLSKEATKAALEAEKEVDNRRQKDALIASKKGETSEMRLSSSEIKKELAPAENNESPLARFLRGKNNPEPAADPFLVADAPKKEPANKPVANKTVREEETLDQLLADKTERDSAQQEKSVARTKSASTSVWDDLISEHLENQPIKQTSEDMSAEVFLAETSNANKPALPEQPWGEQSRALANNSDLPEWAKPAGATSPANKPTTDNKWDSMFGVAEATKPREEPLMKSVLENASAEASVARTLAPAPNSNGEPRQRVNAHLADARSQEQSGDLQGAYRSALMAEAVAIESGIRFSPQEVAPATMAQSISDKIWGKPATQQAANLPQEQPAFAPQSTFSPQPAFAPQSMQQPVATLKPNYDQVFQADSSFPEWKALPPVLANKPASFEQVSPVQAQVQDLRSFRNESASGSESSWHSDPSQGFPAPSFPSSNDSQSQRMELRAPLEAAIVPPSEWEAPAVAQRDFRQELQRTVAHANAPLSVPILPEPESKTARQELIEKFNPPLLTTSKAEEVASISLDQSSEWNTGLPVVVNDNALTASVEEKVPSGYKWGILGILAAIASTIIGLKLARSDDEKTLVSKEKAEDNSTDDQPQLRIRRAA